jgi:UrcA family protein
MTTKLNSAIGAFALLATFGLGAPAFAQSRTPPVPSATVGYRDLDLSSPAGIHTLYERIQHAAWRVCQQTVAVQHGPGTIEILKCREAVVDATVRQLNKPALTALHAGRKSGDVTASG